MHQPSEGSAELKHNARERPDAPLGTLIFRAGLVPADQLEDALEEGARKGRRLGEILLERQLIREDDLARLIASQRGLPFLTGDELRPDPEALALLPAQTALACQAVPVRVDERGALIVAVPDPTDEQRLEQIRSRTDKEPRFAVATKTEISAALSDAYAGQDSVVGARELRQASAEEHEKAPNVVAFPPAEAGADVIESSPGEQSSPGLEATYYRVEVRLSNGERIEAAAGPDRASAHGLAQEFIRSLASNDPSDWPLVAGRFIRPDAIVSVDIVES